MIEQECCSTLQQLASYAAGPRKKLGSCLARGAPHSPPKGCLSRLLRAGADERNRCCSTTAAWQSGPPLAAWHSGAAPTALLRLTVGGPLHAICAVD